MYLNDDGDPFIMVEPIGGEARGQHRRGGWVRMYVGDPPTTRDEAITNRNVVTMTAADALELADKLGRAARRSLIDSGIAAEPVTMHALTSLPGHRISFHTTQDQAAASPLWGAYCSCGWKSVGGYGELAAVQRVADQHLADVAYHESQKPGQYVADDDDAYWVRQGRARRVGHVIDVRRIVYDEPGEDGETDTGLMPWMVECTCGWVSYGHATTDEARQLGEDHQRRMRTVTIDIHERAHIFNPALQLLSGKRSESEVIVAGCQCGWLDQMKWQRTLDGLRCAFARWAQHAESHGVRAGTFAEWQQLQADLAVLAKAGHEPDPGTVLWDMDANGPAYGTPLSGPLAEAVAAGAETAARIAEAIPPERWKPDPDPDDDPVDARIEDGIDVSIGAVKLYEDGTTDSIGYINSAKGHWVPMIRTTMLVTNADSGNTEAHEVCEAPATASSTAMILLDAIAETVAPAEMADRNRRWLPEGVLLRPDYDDPEADWRAQHVAGLLYHVAEFVASQCEPSKVPGTFQTVTRLIDALAWAERALGVR